MKDEISDYFALTAFKLAKGQGKKELADVEGDLNAFVSCMSSDTKLMMFLNHPCVSIEEKIKLVSKIAARPISQRLIALLIKIKKIKAAAGIAEVFSYLIKNENNYMDVDASVAYEMDDKEKEILKNGIEGYIGKKINLNVALDESIIGGVYLKIGNLIVDYTLSKELNFFKERFNTK
jgi:F-type H+-transporting ATPase subunit delta